MKPVFKDTLALIICLFCFNIFLKGQSIEVLKDSLKIAKEDTIKVNLLNSLGKQYYFAGKNDSALYYLSQAKVLCEKSNYGQGLSNTYNVIANVYYNKGNYNQALLYNRMALKIRLQIGDKQAIANSYNNIGNVYYRLNLLQEALKNHFVSLNIRNQLKDTILVSYSYNNISNVYQKQGKFKEALDYLFKCRAIKQSINDKAGLTTCLNNIGVIYTDLKNYPLSLKYHHEALQIATQEKSLENIGITYSNLGNVYFRMKDYKRMEENAYKALQQASEIEDNETIINSNLQLSIAYEFLGDYRKAFEYYHDHITMRDSIYNYENLNSALQSQLQHEFEQKQLAAKAEQQKVEERANEERKKQRWILFFVCFVLVLIIVFTIFIYRNYLQKQKANRIITMQKVEVENQRNKTEEKNKDITASITYAQRIQRAILPTTDYIKKEFPESFLMYQPKDIIGGDFYWISDAVTKYQEKFIMVAVADCTGHGVPGALMSIIGNNFLRLCEHEPSVNRPSEALDFINAGIARTLRNDNSVNIIKDGMDMVFVAIDYSKMILHFSGAKNPIYIISEKKLTEYKGDRQPIGASMEEVKKFTNHSIPIKKGDCIYLFSDGYADQFGGKKGRKFMYANFKELLITNCNLPMQEQYEILMKTFNDWKGSVEQVDDVCVFGFKI